MIKQREEEKVAFEANFEARLEAIPAAAAASGMAAAAESSKEEEVNVMDEEDFNPFNLFDTGLPMAEDEAPMAAEDRGDGAASSSHEPPETLDEAALAAEPPHLRNQLIVSRKVPAVYKILPDHAGTITAMLLEMGVRCLLTLL